MKTQAKGFFSGNNLAVILGTSPSKRQAVKHGQIFQPDNENINNILIIKMNVHFYGSLSGSKDNESSISVALPGAGLR